MEDTSNFNRRRQTIAKSNSRKINNPRVREHCTDFNMEEGDSEMWNNFSNNFRQVQSVLDRNRLLIQQVNENHQSRTHDSMVQNVSLIQELNGNISQVSSIYSDINTDFTNMIHQRKNDV
ncbi:hypothetical protein R3W88_016470 [Solanum pinnatisectum]|uniref:Protein EARLY FLOWERING 4 domain-containing protein n=1 Tax=Solanum pinnatisectum TaxID=50273 RepID=A0AAV9KXH4_9SOLN|nr:hypothetical protein R3W88_016470 [Solanum pinnatisectum]